MSLADYRRAAEMSGIQAGLGALADAMLAARPPAPPAPPAASAPGASIDTPPVVASADDIRADLRERGLVDSPYGSNAWAFGREVTADGGGLLLGNPHFPWVGPNRFWQMHLTVPGQFDVMGAAIGLSGIVQIGFNKDVAWSHTVSTGKRFTLYELALVPGDATAYLVDGKVEKMTPKTARYAVRGDDGKPSERSVTTWWTRWGPVVVLPRAGLNWTDKLAYALKDANAGNVRGTDTWLAFARATRVEEMRDGMRNLGLPWVNTIAADRHGHAMYADVSVVPDVDAAHLARCAPGKPAAALMAVAGIPVLDGSRSDCDWHRDPVSPVAGLTPIERMPVAIRTDWVHNSNDSFFYTHPGHAFGAISTMVGDDTVRRPRTRSGLIEIPELIAAGKLTPAAVQNQLFADRNLMGRMTVPDLLAACAQAPTPEARDGCEALRGWDQRSDLGSRGAHLFREFWRAAATIPGVYRQPFDKARPVETPAGLKLDDADTAAKIWGALAASVKKVRAAGFALDDPLGRVQQAVFSTEGIPLHGGDETEGTLNNLGDRMAPGIGPNGIRIDYGSSYIQTVRFDARGPVAQAILTYGQSSDPASPHLTDQLKLFSAKTWPTLPFHAADVEKARVGEVLTLIVP
jgi:acyl-homoserine-lactone acylase